VSPDEPLRVLMVVPEAAPFAKTGGLADVAAALPAALARLGHDVTVVMPRYRGIPSDGRPAPFELPIGHGLVKGRWLETRLEERRRVVFVDYPPFYDREAPYGIGNDDFPDNARRFALLSRAALEFAVREGIRVSAVHAHEWQAGLVPVYLQHRYASHPALAGASSIFTVHNLAYQGVFSPLELSDLDLEQDLFEERALEYWGGISFLKGGINFAHTITTVSPRYAKEVLTPEFGFGFDGILKRRERDLVGILNGIDTEHWDPANDRYLPAPYSRDDLAAKAQAKAALLKELRLPADGAALDRPVIGVVSRLVDQKGFDLMPPAAEALMRLSAVFTVVGTGERRYEEFWERLAHAHPDRVAARIGFSERLAHLVEGGADMFLMPSRFEPCGLNQMYSLRYGTVPIVRAVGGLDDTVQDYNPRTGTGTGFKFREYTPEAMLSAIRRALEVFERRDEWRALQAAGMAQDHSWDVSAREYVKVYGRVGPGVRRAGVQATAPGRGPS
jgi:starch synthase